MRYLMLTAVSYLGTKTVGLERTIVFFRKMGTARRRIFGTPKATNADTIYSKLGRGYAWLPFAIRCLDQALVTWYLMNVNGHPASMKIGITLSPLTSHAWVELGQKIFVESYWIPDMEVLADYPPFSS